MIGAVCLFCYLCQKSAKDTMNRRLFQSFCMTMLAISALGLMPTACTKSRHATQTASTKPSKPLPEPQKPTKTYKNLRLIGDTTCAGWRVILASADGPTKVKGENYYDKLFLITLYKNGRLLFDKKEISTEKLHGKPRPELQLTPGYIELITRTAVYIDAATFYPETDDGWFFSLLFDKNGRLSVRPFIIEMSEADNVASFYRAWLNECRQKPIDKASLEMVANRYCTPSFAKQLLREAPLSLLPAKVVGKYRLDVDVMAELTHNSEDYLEQRGTVYFCTKDYEQQIDSLAYELRNEQDENGYTSFGGITGFKKFHP